MRKINRHKFKHLAKKGDSSAKMVHDLLSKPEQLFSVIRLSNTFAIIIFSSIFTQLAIKKFGNLNLLESLTLNVASLLFIMVCTMSTPKIFATNYPHLIASLYSFPLKHLVRLLYPLVWFSTSISNIFLRLMGAQIAYANHVDLTVHHEHDVINNSRIHLPQSHGAMSRIQELNYTTVEDIMIPCSEIEALDISLDWDFILEKIIDWPHTCIIFYESKINNLLGIIHLKKILQLFKKQQLNKDNLQNHLTDCYFIPESTTLANQIINFQSSSHNTSLVVNEYGEITGLITLQDILSEIVGESEQNALTNTAEIMKQTDGSVLIAGSTYVRDINRELNWELPESGPKTISGLIIENLENIPKSPVCLVIDKYKIEIISLHKNTIKVVKVHH